MRYRTRDHLAVLARCFDGCSINQNDIDSLTCGDSFRDQARTVKGDRQGTAGRTLKTNRAQQWLREALALPVEERADVAAELLASLDEPGTMDPAAVEAAWAREIDKRARRVMAGESLGEPWEDVRARVARRLAER